MTRLWSNALVDAYCVLSLPLGGMLFVTIARLSGAAWPSAVRRAADALVAALPAAALMMLALVFGRGALWTSGHRDAFLSVPFIFVRMALALALWAACARAMRRGSVRAAAIFAVVFALTFSVVSIDWLLAFTPHWSTTMFAAYQGAGVILAGLAAVTLLAAGAADVDEEQRHDLGKLLFAFATFWGYLWFCQYLLVWYTNLPEEASFYAVRTEPAWRAWFYLNFAVNFAVPFAVLLSRRTKRQASVLAAVAALLLVGRWIDVYLTVMPQTLRTPAFGAAELLIAGAYAGAAAGTIAWSIARR